MKSTSRAFIALALCLCVLFTALAGCASEQEASGEKSPVVESQAPAEASEAPENSAAPEEQSAAVPETASNEQPGATGAPALETEASVKYTDIVLPITQKPASFSLFCSAVAPSVQSVLPEGYNDENALAMKYLEGLTGVSVDFQTVDGFVMSEKFNLMVAAEEYTDVISGFSSQYATGAGGGLDDGVIRDLNDYSEHIGNYLAVLEAFPQFKSDAYTDNGEMSFILGFIDETVVETGGGIRRDYLDALGLDMPETYDELYEAGMAIKDKYDSSATFYFTSGLMPGAAFAGGYDLPAFDITGSNNSFYQIDGQVQCALIADGLKDFLTMMKKWYDAGLMQADWYTQRGGSTAETVIYSGDCAVWWGTLINLTKFNNLAETEGFTAVALPNTVKEKGQTTHFRSVSNTSGANLSITTACGDDMVPVILTYLDYMFTPDGQLLCNYGLEGQSYHLDAQGLPQYNESVYSYSDGASTFTVLLAPYVPTDGILPSLYDGDRAVAARYDAANADSVALYTNDGSDDAYTLPSLTLTPEENEAVSTYLADCETLAAECLVKFVTGEMDIDTQWDSYVAQMKSMGMEKVVAAKQTAYQRYLGR